MNSISDFFSKQFYHNTVGNWFISLAIILGAVILARAIYWFINRVLLSYTSKTQSNVDDLILHSIKEPIVFMVAIAAGWYGLERLSFPEEWQLFFSNVFNFLGTIGVTWLLVRILDSLVNHILLPIVEKSESDFDDQLLPIVQKGLRTIIWILGIIVGLNNAGYNVNAIIASLGIGGLAFAMAAKDSIANIFGGFTIFTDKPFRINDRIKINGFDGVISEIGIRSTRLTTLEGRVVTIPNSKFIDGLVENVTLEPARKVVLKLGLVYETPASKMQLAMDTLGEVQKSMDGLREDYITAFTDFGDFSLGITFIYYIKKGEDNFMKQSEMNLKILQSFNEKELEMAFPTQTIHTKSID